MGDMADLHRQNFPVSWWEEEECVPPLKTKKPSRTYRIEYGGMHAFEEPWYDYDEFTLYEGDICPDCNKGKLVVSQQNKLYCSNHCWLNEIEMDAIEGDFE